MKTVLHLTDLYHPHNDPDDHWDLACQYALFKGGDIRLAGVICDAKRPEFGDPSIQSIAQLNSITQQSVPVAIGSSQPIRSAADLERAASGPLPASVKMILQALENMDEVAIHICGSCRDVAIAAAAAPELFREKCAGIYLNAGSSKPGTRLEWNVWLEPYSYARIFQIPCKIYWLPCFYESPVFIEHAWGSFFTLAQGDILPELSEGLQKYFLYMFTQDLEHGWLDYLERPLDRPALARFSQNTRALYCTPGFFHCAGHGVTDEGRLTEADGADSVFSFEPVGVQVTDDGMLHRVERGAQSNIWMMVKRDAARFHDAMNAAVKNLLMGL